ncbi:MAG: xanthine dehydrogenase family protein molybdopterin-binding subunit [Dethiobacteria bacterium]
MRNFHVIGKSLHRKEDWSKVAGSNLYTDDLRLSGMLYAKVLRSKVPSAVVKRIDCEDAIRLPGVAAVLTANDIPGRNAVGIILKDEPVLVTNKIRRVGDALAVVAAESRNQAEQAVQRIKVELIETPGVFSPQLAMETGSPLVHDKSNILACRRIRKGNIEEAFKKAEVIIERTYRTGHVEHAAMEPESSLAQREGDNITVWVSSQNPHFDRGEIAAVLGIGQRKVRVIQQPTGGGFGGKLDISTQCHTALLAWYTHRPVKLTYTREESFVASGKRHPYVIKYISAADKRGMLLGVKAELVIDTGAYASYGPGVLTRGAIHVTGPYEVPNVYVDAYCVYTNNPYCGAMRGFGVPQVGFAHETQMDLLAEELGLSPWEIRIKNFLRAGSLTSTSQVLRQSVGIRETMIRVKKEVMGDDTR